LNKDRLKNRKGWFLNQIFILFDRLFPRRSKEVLMGEFAPRKNRRLDALPMLPIYIFAEEYLDNKIKV
jgi:hypothetical protein